ncbi:MAG: tRNA (adenosine(37)-N6)-threonylcarbamoyltransferase complex ATPase subunit type 1 TsaE [Candidatus Paceibacteria bacterium]
MHLTVLTKSERETRLLAKILARSVLWQPYKKMGATVISLEGPLGSGKTTFIQGFSKGLGLKRTPQSPTFLLMKRYFLKKKKKQFWHIDCFRLKRPAELLQLGFTDVIRDSGSIVVIEWGDKIKRILPNNTLRVLFSFAPIKNWRLILFCKK